MTGSVSPEATLKGTTPEGSDAWTVTWACHSVPAPVTSPSGTVAPPTVRMGFGTGLDVCTSRVIRFPMAPTWSPTNALSERIDANVMAGCSCWMRNLNAPEATPYPVTTKKKGMPAASWTSIRPFMPHASSSHATSRYPEYSSKPGGSARAAGSAPGGGSLGSGRGDLTAATTLSTATAAESPPPAVSRRVWGPLVRETAIEAWPTSSQVRVSEKETIPEGTPSIESSRALPGFAPPPREE
mmetsp:Transcript_2198/g.7819  ORF Transcript_2198/g.7819 Transcript_2198/m.7819 type:complete len:241 (+) Transcript_2198:4875-5597(+)